MECGASLKGARARSKVQPAPTDSCVKRDIRSNTSTLIILLQQQLLTLAHNIVDNLFVLLQ